MASELLNHIQANPLFVKIKYNILTCSMEKSSNILAANILIPGCGISSPNAISKFAVFSLSDVFCLVKSCRME